MLYMGMQQQRANHLKNKDLKTAHDQKLLIDFSYGVDKHQVEIFICDQSDRKQSQEGTVLTLL